MKHFLKIVIFAFFIFSPRSFVYGHGLFFQLFGAWAKICATVVDDDGVPVNDALVTATYRLYFTGWGKCVNNVSALTDSDGRADLVGRCDVMTTGIIVEKDGYYRTEEDKTVKLEDTPGGEGVYVKLGRWQPYGVKKTYILKEIRNPVPMVVFSGITMSPPAINEEFGFDLEYGDYIKPFGDGEVADFLVRFEGNENEQQDLRKMIMTFPNAFDGAYICSYYEPSQLKSPYRADEQAQYLKELVFSKTWTIDSKNGYRMITDQNFLADNQALILRTRSKVDANGTLISAHYSKIYGKFDIGGSFWKGLQLTLGGITTYFNPVENDTSLECDGKLHPELRKGKRENEKAGPCDAL